MTALLLWSILPGLAAGLLYVLRRWERAVTASGTATALLLAWLAWQFPIGESIPLRLWVGLPSLRIEPVHMLFGSRFTLDDPTRPVLVLLYLSSAFWFAGTGAARAPRLFVPFGLAALALISAAFGAESVPMATLLLGMATMLGIPIVSSPGDPTRRGAVRLLVYITCGVCLVLFADASLAIKMATPGDSLRDPTAAMLLLGLGFALILAVIPFHTWMPMLGEETHPYTAAFIFYLIPAAASFLAFETLTRYSIAGLSPAMFTVLRYAGALMAVGGGVGAAFERHLGRIMATGAITMTGMILIAISLNDQLGRPTELTSLIFVQLGSTGLGLAIWGMALTVLRVYVPDLSYRSVRGAAHAFPAATGALLLAHLSLAGAPLLAGFPAHLALWTSLAQRTASTALLASLGAASLGVAALRSLAVLTRPDMPPETAQQSTGGPAGGPAEPPANTPSEPVSSPSPVWRIGEERLQVFLLACGALLLFVAGIFPQIYLPILTSMAALFAGPTP